MQKIQNLTLPQAKELLKSLRTYQDISKKVGRRWRSLFERNNKGMPLYVVEYLPNVEEDFVYGKSLPVFEKFFGVTPKKEEVVFVKKEWVLWGMKVYMDDNLVDMSFKKVVDKLKH